MTATPEPTLLNPLKAIIAEERPDCLTADTELVIGRLRRWDDALRGEVKLTHKSTRR